jgi:uncharacterized repeat protein (TIGR01451 family)
MTARRAAISGVFNGFAACEVRHTGERTPERILRARMKTARFPTLLKVIGAAAMLVIAAVPLHAFAQKREAPVEAKLEARKVVRAANASEAFASGDVVKPGDVIEYVATFRNTSDKPVRNLEPTLPLPEHTELVAGSARPANVTAGLDERTFAPIPLKRKTVANGRETIENVPYREYRYLRWAPVDLEPGRSMSVIARVKVLE